MSNVAPVRERREPDKHRTEGAEGGLEVEGKTVARRRGGRARNRRKVGRSSI